MKKAPRCNYATADSRKKFIGNRLSAHSGIPSGDNDRYRVLGAVLDFHSIESRCLIQLPMVRSQASERRVHRYRASTKGHVSHDASASIVPRFGTIRSH